MISEKVVKLLQFDVTNADSGCLQLLRKSMSSWLFFTHLAFSVPAFGTLMVLGLCLLPILVKCTLHSLFNICADIHHINV